MRRPADYTPLIATLRDARAPVTGPVLADLAGLPRRTTQRWLTTLEQRGVVEWRPTRGVRYVAGGWVLRQFESSNVARHPAHLC